MSRFVAGPDFYNYDMYGGLRPGGVVRFFSLEFIGLVAATFTSAFVYIGARYGLLPMVSSQLQLSETQTEAMDRLVEVPAALAFFVGLYADAVPVWGSRRKAYMVLGMLLSLLCLAAIGLGCLFAQDMREAIGSSFSYIMMLLMGGVSFGSMINFCSVHTAAVTLSQRESLERRGVFQADYLVARAAGQISARLLVYVIQNVVVAHEIALILLVLVSLSVMAIVVVVGGLDEPPAYRKESLRCKCESYWKLTKQKAVWRILLIVASFAFFLNFGFPLVTQALRQWTDTTDSASALLSNSLNDLVMILTVLAWRWRLRNMLWKKFFPLAPTMTIVPQVVMAVLVVPALYRSPAVYVVLTGVAGVSTGVMALVLLVPVTEIIEEGSEGGVVGLALSFNTIFKVFVSTLLTSIQRASYFPSGADARADTTQYRWSIAILEAVTCAVNSLAFAVVPILPLQKLDAQLVRMYGGFTDHAGALTAAAFLTSLAYCVAYNIYIFSQALH
ncbi:putative transmembrane protein [Phytophthora cinnamomi]|uniref:putative transmembrane protein n=1 Tax=Phytophthora cinnamomi TaxID=4785 RepID=UPI003559B23E|nr:putative transmembrane protein [Phytophthora cinnamomi]